MSSKSLKYLIGLQKQSKKKQLVSFLSIFKPPNLFILICGADMDMVRNQCLYVFRFIFLSVSILTKPAGMPYRRWNRECNY